MPELRQNRFTKEWVIIATERAKRPEELRNKKERPPLPALSGLWRARVASERLASP